MGANELSMDTNISYLPWRASQGQERRKHMAVAKMNQQSGK